MKKKLAGTWNQKKKQYIYIYWPVQINGNKFVESDQIDQILIKPVEVVKGRILAGSKVSQNPGPAGELQMEEKSIMGTLSRRRSPEFDHV